MSDLPDIDSSALIIIIPILALVFFLPTIIGFVLNREHKGKIFIANILSAASGFAWCAVVIWALTGKSKPEASVS